MGVVTADGRGRNERTLGVGFSLFFGACVAIIPWWGISGLSITRHHIWLENSCSADLYKRDGMYSITDTFPRAEYCAYKEKTFSGTEIVKYRVTSTGEMIIWSALLVLIIAAAVIGLVVIIAGIVGSIIDLYGRLHGETGRPAHGPWHQPENLAERASARDSHGGPPNGAPRWPGHG